MKDFRDLDVWDGAHRLTLSIYTLTAKFPREEVYGITSQTRRCRVSIDANIAEGARRQATTNFNVSSKSLLVLPANWITNCCLRKIFATWPHRNT